MKKNMIRYYVIPLITMCIFAIPQALFAEGSEDGGCKECEVWDPYAKEWIPLDDTEPTDCEAGPAPLSKSTSNGAVTPSFIMGCSACPGGGGGGAPGKCYQCCKGSKVEVPCKDEDPCKWYNESDTTYKGTSKAPAKGALVCIKGKTYPCVITQNLENPDYTYNEGDIEAIGECVQKHEDTHAGQPQNPCPKCGVDVSTAPDGKKKENDCAAYQAQRQCLEDKFPNPDQRSEGIEKEFERVGKGVSQNCS